MFDDVFEEEEEQSVMTSLLKTNNQS